MNKKKILAIILTLVTVALLIFSSPIAAKKGDNNPGSGEKPGYGYGDDNHDHSGPPGLGGYGYKPGWGYGDVDRDHSGPPGQDK